MNFFLTCDNSTKSQIWKSHQILYLKYSVKVLSHRQWRHICLILYTGIGQKFKFLLCLLGSEENSHIDYTKGFTKIKSSIKDRLRICDKAVKMNLMWFFKRF